jgi:hypothetical protein
MSADELVIRFPIFTLAREMELLDEDFRCGLSPLAPIIKTGDGSFRALLLFTDREGAEEYLEDPQIRKPVCLVKMANFETARAFLRRVSSAEVDRVVLDPRQRTALRTWTLDAFMKGFDGMTE